MTQVKKNGCPFCGQQHDPDVLVCPMTGMSLRFSDPEKAVGEIIGEKYRLSSLIGRGGMGSVFEAVNIQLDKKVAIKILLPESANINQVTERFKREARSAASIGHENIVDVYDFDTTQDGVVFIVMELLSGYDFAELLKSDNCVPLERTSTIAVQTARALGAAHERGIIHRDLKPENIFLTQRKSGEVVKIVDFGIAMIKEHGSLSRLTTDGILLGTPYYMSPEQARGAKDIDHRVDIYALGAVLFEALTGTVLFSGETYLEVISKHQMETPPLLQERKHDLVVPDLVEDIIMKMLLKDPAKRPATMEEVEEALLPFSSERKADHTTVNSGKFVEFAETIADTGSEAAPAPSLHEKQHTTPVQWEEKEKTRGFFTPKTILITLGIVIAFAVSVLVAAIAFDKDSEDEQGAPQSYPIATAPKKNSKIAVEKISVSIAASPKGATIMLDGKALEGNPAEINLERSSREATITIEAKGYITKTRVIKLDKNRDIDLSLDREHKPKAGATTKPKPGKNGKKDTVEPDKKPKKGKGAITVTQDSPYKK